MRTLAIFLVAFLASFSLFAAENYQLIGKIKLIKSETETIWYEMRLYKDGRDNITKFWLDNDHSYTIDQLKNEAKIATGCSIKAGKGFSADQGGLINISMLGADDIKAQIVWENAQWTLKGTNGKKISLITATLGFLGVKKIDIK